MTIRRSFRYENGVLYRYPLRRERRRRPQILLCRMCHTFEPLYEGTLCAHCYNEVGVGA